MDLPYEIPYEKVQGMYLVTEKGRRQKLWAKTRNHEVHLRAGLKTQVHVCSVSLVGWDKSKYR